MKKIILAISFFVLTGNVSAQDKCDEKVQKLLIDKIKGIKATDLLPYQDAESKDWGLFNKRTGKKVTTPVFSTFPPFFRPSLTFSYSFEERGQDGCSGTVISRENDYQLKKVENSGYTLMAASPPRKEEVKYSEFIKKEKGFDVDNNGNLTYFSDEFYDKEENKPLISDIFKFKEKFYAAAFVKEQNLDHSYWIIIDQKGNIIRKLGRLADIKPIYSSDKTNWFSTGANEDFQIVSIFGDEKIVDITEHPYFDKYLGYALIHTKNGDGVLDLLKMDWVFPPQKKNKFQRMDFTSLEDLNQSHSQITQAKDILANRKIANVFLINDKGEILNLKGKKFKVKQ